MPLILLQLTLAQIDHVWDQVIKQFQDIKHEYSPLERDHRSTLRLHSVSFEFRDKVDPAVLQARIQQKGLRLEFVDPGYLKLQPELIEVSSRT